MIVVDQLLENEHGVVQFAGVLRTVPDFKNSELVENSDLSSRYRGTDNGYYSKSWRVILKIE